MFSRGCVPAALPVALTRAVSPPAAEPGTKEPPQGVKLLPSAMTAFAVNVACADAQAEPG